MIQPHCCTTLPATHPESGRWARPAAGRRACWCRGCCPRWCTAAPTGHSAGRWPAGWPWGWTAPTPCRCGHAAVASVALTTRTAHDIRRRVRPHPCALCCIVTHRGVSWAGRRWQHLCHAPTPAPMHAQTHRQHSAAFCALRRPYAHRASSSTRCLSSGVATSPRFSGLIASNSCDSGGRESA